MAPLTGAERDMTIATVGAAHMILHLGRWTLEQASATLIADEQPGGPHPGLRVYAEMAGALRAELRAVPASAAVADLVRLIDSYLEDVATLLGAAAGGNYAALSGGAASGLESAGLAQQALAAVMARLGPPGAGSPGRPGG
jgi:hypothetical protein